MNYEKVSEKIIQKICECGWKAYLCGGAVRDEFIGLEADDYDIVTDATPEDLEKIFSDRKVKLIGASFLVTLIDGVEVSTYRSDKNFGPDRHNCISSSCETLEEDLERRDFTFNAMAVCPYLGEIIDPFNGRKDLENKVIRFVGNPDKRIFEDYIRMIRAARFTCRIEGKLDSESFNSIYMNRKLISEIAPERIRNEILKTMKYRKPSIFFNILHSTGILKIILPEMDQLYGHTGGDHHAETLDVHAMLTGDYLSPKRPILRLIGYLHDIGKPASYSENDEGKFTDHEKIGFEMSKEICNRYRFSSAETKKIKNLILHHIRYIDDNMTEKAVRRMIKKFHDDNVDWKEWLMLRIADNRANLKNKNYTKNQIKNIILKIYNSQRITSSGGFTIKDLDINGNDIMDVLNIQPGKEIGIILKKLLEIVIENPEKNNRKELLTIIKEGQKMGKQNGDFI